MRGHVNNTYVNATSSSGSPRAAFGPVDHDRPGRGDDHVHRVEVEVHEASPPPASAQPIGRGDRVQAVVQVGEHRGVARHAPRLRIIASIIIGPSMRSITISVPPARTSWTSGTG